MSFLKVFHEEGVDAAETFIQNHQDFTLNTRLTKMSRAGHQMLFVSFQGVNYVFKRFADTPADSFGRRLEFFLLNLFRDPALRSYQGALMLKEAGVPVIEPVACVTSRVGLGRVGVFVYLELPAIATLAEWHGENQTSPLVVDVFKQLAEIVRLMDRSKLRQTDFTMRNILVSQSSDESDRLSLALIDTDDVYQQGVGWLSGSIQLKARLWFLRRLRPSEPMSRVFLKAYLDKEYTEEALEQWLSIRKSNSNLIKKLKRRLKRK